MMLKKPKIDDRMPEAMTSRQRGRPRFCTLVACLFMLPRMLKPSTIMALPRKTKPDWLLRSGQLRTKYDLKRLSSETIRKMLIVLVMKWETPSKK